MNVSFVLAGCIIQKSITTNYMHLQQSSDDQAKMFLELAEALYEESADEEGVPLRATIDFDDAQRIKEIQGVYVDDQPRIIGADAIERLNKIAEQIQKMSDGHDLSRLQIVVQNGEADIVPTYRDQ